MAMYRSPGDMPPPPHPSAPGVSVCRVCGVVAPARGTTCSVCSRPLSETRCEVPAAEDDSQWVALRCTFTCNQCRFPAPLDDLDADGAVDCASCGLHQRFDVDAWRQAIDFAHGVADLAGPAPEGHRPHPVIWIGSENPYAALGDTRTFERCEGISMNELAVEAAPGHPVCRACHVPLTTSSPRRGAVTTRCPRCGATAAYGVADAAIELSDALVAVVADEHRSDRPRARPMPTQSGVIALSCPGCGAPLSVSGRGRLQTCAFCHASCLVPVQSLSLRGQDAAAPEIWWILVRGRSAKRAELEAPTTEAASSVVKNALDWIKPGGDHTPIGDAPGVYTAPEVEGIYWPQVGITLALGSVAVVLGFLIFEIFAG